jgi:ATPase subunit of ABC transporter with duplicated ATPase domains
LRNSSGGAGKCTLLKLIAGEYQPISGSVSADGVLGYLPQTLPLTGTLTVAEVLEIAPIVRALAAIERATGCTTCSATGKAACCSSATIGHCFAVNAHTSRSARCPGHALITGRR